LIWYNTNAFVAVAVAVAVVAHISFRWKNVTDSVAVFVGPTQLATDREPWERQPFEGDREWALFKIYRDLPPELRSIWRAIAIYNGEISPDDTKADYREKLREIPGWADVLTVKHRWRERIEAFDRYSDGVILQALLASRARALFEVAQLGRMLRMTALEAAQTLQKAVHEGTKELSPASIARLAETGSRLERAALGMEAALKGSARSPNLAVTLNVSSSGVEVQAESVPDEELIERAMEILQSRVQVIEGSYAEIVPEREE